VGVPEVPNMRVNVWIVVAILIALVAGSDCLSVLTLASPKREEAGLNV
jgi:hypothetical protein